MEHHRGALRILAYRPALPHRRSAHSSGARRYRHLDRRQFPDRARRSHLVSRYANVPHAAGMRHAISMTFAGSRRERARERLRNAFAPVRRVRARVRRALRRLRARREIARTRPGDGDGRQPRDAPQPHGVPRSRVDFPVATCPRSVLTLRRTCARSSRRRNRRSYRFLSASVLRSLLDLTCSIFLIRSHATK